MRKLFHKMVPHFDKLIMVKNPDQNEYSKNNVEVGDIHQPLKKTHLLLGSPEPLFGLSLNKVRHFSG